MNAGYGRKVRGWIKELFDGMSIKEKKNYIKHSLMFYIVAYSMFFCTSYGIIERYFFIRARQFLVLAVVAFVVQLATKRVLFCRKNIIPIILGITWMATWPILSNLDGIAHASMLTVYDVLTGAYLTFFLILFQQFCRWRVLRLLYAACCVGTLFIPIAHIIHFALYGHPIDDTSLMGVSQTTLLDWWSWLLAYIGYLPLVGCIAVFAIFFAVTYYYGNRIYNTLVHRGGYKVCAILLLILAWYFGKTVLPRYSLIHSWNQVQTYLAEEKMFQQNHAELYADMQLHDPENTAAKRAPGTIILVIGESASRDHMQVYHPDYPYEDTPWMTRMVSQPGVTVFRNAYACYNQTAVALSYVLTESSQYNGKRFYDSDSIVDVAHKAGYDTYWFTNQGGIGKDDAPVTMVAKLADHVMTPAGYEDHIVYDGDLLPFLKEVDGTKNNFVVIHLMGSHALYKFRCPPDQTKWTDGEPASEYANSLLYTDSILQQIFDYAQQNLRLQAMIYLSDHGENIYEGHHPQMLGFEQVRIPMFIYTSAQYMQAYPDKSLRLRKRENAYFSNDMLYDTIAGLLGATSNHSDSHQDLTSEDYAYHRDNVMTFLGKRFVREDE